MNVLVSVIIIFIYTSFQDIFLELYSSVSFFRHLISRHAGDMFTGRNEVVAKVMFLLVSVILSTVGVLSQHALQLVSQHALQLVSGGVPALGGLLWGDAWSRGGSAPGGMPGPEGGLLPGGWGCLLPGLGSSLGGVCFQGVWPSGLVPSD